MDIFFDESGFTGPALLDAAQPYFCVASSNVAGEVAQDVIRAAFPRFQGQEAKFQALWRRRNYRRGFIQFAEQIRDRRLSAFTWLVDKRFCLFQKFVDFLIEPELHDTGFDFYAGGHAPKFCNYAYAAIHALGSAELYLATTDTYYRFVRNPTPVALEELRATLARMANSVTEELRWFYGLAALGAMRFHDHHVIEEFDDTVEIQLTCVLASVAHWRSQFDEEFRILHDNSRNFFGQRAIWDNLTADDVPPQLHPVANGPPLAFPLRIRETIPADSREHPSIQFCDLLAGLVIKAHKPGEGDEELVREIVEAGLGDITHNGIMPRDDFPEGPPQKLSGPDAVDRLMAIMRPGRS
ncbi:DUF3800 domain-containing protein [Phenylobacterium sp.]|uniref:DUF3800 domain-containing protein n=1 Tax=Phenylobacterium sp. TaxID=1871053 RepID=UPI002FC8BF52